MKYTDIKIDQNVIHLWWFNTIGREGAIGRISHIERHRDDIGQNWSVFIVRYEDGGYTRHNSAITLSDLEIYP